MKIMPNTLFYCFMFFAANLLNCTDKKQTCKNPLPPPWSVKLTLLSDSNSIGQEHNSILAELKNTSKDTIVVECCRYSNDSLKWFIPEGLRFFSILKREIISYQGPVPIPERWPEVIDFFIDSLPPDSNLTLQLEPIYQNVFTDSLDYIGFSLPIIYPKLFSDCYYDFGTSFEMVEYPYFVFQFKNKQFIDVTDWFFLNYPRLSSRPNEHGKKFILKNN